MYIIASHLFLRLLSLLLRLRRRQLERIRLAVLAGTNLLPGRRATLKVTEGLSELKWLSNDTLLLFIVSDFGVAREGEVLAQRMALKAVVGHDAAEIRVTDEDDAEQVVHLSLEPVGTSIEAGDAGHGRRFVGIRLHADAGVMTDAEEVVDDLEALLAAGIVDSCNRADLCELGRGIVYSYF